MSIFLAACSDRFGMSKKYPHYTRMCKIRMPPHCRRLWGTQTACHTEKVCFCGWHIYVPLPVNAHTKA